MDEQHGDGERWTSLSGFWTGSYWYAGQAQPTAFNAYFSETGGDLSGTTLEPATFGETALSEFCGAIEGVRTGSDVSFVKRYDPGQGVHSHPIFYAGTADPTLSRIEGGWRFDIPFYPSGGFRLERLKRTAMKAKQLESVSLLRQWLDEGKA